MMALSQTASTPQQVPELGHLKAAAERLSQVNYNLSSFYVRFFGPMPESSNADQAEAPSCYRNDLTAVFEQISRLEEMVNNLTNIG
jgi:hypothetical protein